MKKTKKRFQLHNPRKDGQHDYWHVFDTKNNKFVKHGLGGTWTGSFWNAREFMQNMNRLYKITTSPK